MRGWLSFLVGVLSILQAVALEKHSQSQDPGSVLARSFCRVQAAQSWRPTAQHFTALCQGPGRRSFDSSQNSPIEIDQAQARGSTAALHQETFGAGQGHALACLELQPAEQIVWTGTLLENCDSISAQLTRCGKSNDGCLAQG